MFVMTVCYVSNGKRPEEDEYRGRVERFLLKVAKSTYTRQGRRFYPQVNRHK